MRTLSNTQTKTALTNELNRDRSGILQRKCESCGQHTIAGGECTSCAKKTGSLQRKLMIGASNDPLELEADRIAVHVMATPAHSTVSSSLPHIQRYTGQATEGLDTAPASVDRVLASPGSPLEPSLRQDMEQRFRHDFSQVRVHTGMEAERSTREVNANAYTVKHNIVFGAGQFSPKTNDGQRLIAHELTHVVQQSNSDSMCASQSIYGHRPLSVPSVAGRMILARQVSDDADAQVSLGYLDSPYVGKIAEELIGHNHWLVLREFLRGLWAGLKSASPEQIQRINKKFDEFGITDALKYTGGYAFGIIEGIWLWIKGLIEAVITLVKLPYDIGKFLGENVPKLAERYGPRIAQFLTEGGGLTGQLNKVLDNFLKDPSKSIRQISSFLDALGGFALTQVRVLGRSAAGKTLEFLEEPWFDYGRDIGKVVGQILIEVILAVASDAIGNIVKESLTIAGRISARLVTGVVELIKSVGRYLGEAVEWVTRLGRRAAGELAEMFEGLRAFLSKLRALIAELGEEGALANTGSGRIPIPEATLPVLEARIAKPPIRTSPATVADLTPPKVHPSNLPKDVPGTKKPTIGKAPSASATPSLNTESNLRTFSEGFHSAAEAAEQERILELARRDPVQAGREYENLVRKELGDPPYGDRIITSEGNVTYRVPDYPAPGEITIQGRWVSFSDDKIAQIRTYLEAANNKSVILTVPRLSPEARQALVGLSKEFPEKLIVVRETWLKYATTK